MEALAAIYADNPARIEPEGPVVRMGDELWWDHDDPAVARSELRARPGWGAARVRRLRPSRDTATAYLLIVVGVTTLLILVLDHRRTSATSGDGQMLIVFFAAVFMGRRLSLGLRSGGGGAVGAGDRSGDGAEHRDADTPPGWLRRWGVRADRRCRHALRVVRATAPPGAHRWLASPGRRCAAARVQRWGGGGADANPAVGRGDAEGPHRSVAGSFRAMAMVAVAGTAILLEALLRSIRGQPLSALPLAAGRPR